MPPRRSTRASLPTPAASVASTEATPRANKYSTQTGANGLVTPVSMSDGDGMSDGRTEVDDDEAMSKTDAPASTSAARYTLEGVIIPSRRSRLGVDQTNSSDNLTLGSPVSKRAKFSGEPIKIEHEVPPSSDPLDVISPPISTFPINASRRSAAKAAAQPFNVGKYSKVAKASATELEFDKDDLAVHVDAKPKLETSSSTTRARRSLGSSTAKVNGSTKAVKGKGRTAKKEPAASESEFDGANGNGDYAMDSDDEERQLKSAIQASAAKGMEEKFGSSTGTGPSTAMTSRASSVGGAGPGRGARTPAKRESVGRRAAVIRSAESTLLPLFILSPTFYALDCGSVETFNSRLPNAPDCVHPLALAVADMTERRAIKAEPEASDLSPSESTDSEFGGSDFDDGLDSEDAALTELSSDGESAFSDSPAPLKPASKAKGKATAKKTASKGTAAGKKTGKAFTGKGRKLVDDSEKDKDYDGNDSEQEGDDDDDMAEEDLDALDDDETRTKTITDIKQQRRAERKAANKSMEGIRKEEAKMKKELGRKLTNGEKNIIRLVKHHPELHNVWGDLAASVPPIKPEVMDAHPALKLSLLPFQKESLYWMKKQEEGVWKGGMLADEMGMGKTIQTIALLLSEPRRKPSLVVAPVVALMQWKHEIENNTDGFTVCVWHGQGRMKADDLKKYDVVLVSYGTLEASFRRQQRGFKRGDHFIKEKSPMHSFEWYRVILDEAHNIKERSTNAAKAAFALQAQYKWCLSGTPLQNRVGELYSLVRFLGADPFSHYFCKKCDCKSLHWKFSDKRHCDQCKHKPMDHVCFWNTEILTPIARYGIETGGPGHTAFKKLKVLLDRMMLRRTKLERADDLGLPPRTIVVRRDYFSPEEKELYMSLFTGAKRQFSTYINQGTVLNNYSNIFSLITRMRQMACHPDLVLRSKTGSLKAVDVDHGNVCRLCQDSAEDAIVSACKHVFDRECIRQYLEVQQNRGHRPECPVCHIEISIDLEQEAIELDQDDGKKARQGILSRLDIDNWRSSSKLEALVEELEKLRNKDCTIKSLVFSQFVSFLDLIAFRLQRAGFNICRLEGGMTPQQRDATIQHFMNNTGVTVFLISLKAGGVALNLTEASMVFMMDSWWNPSVEYQAMDRIHRLGQKRPVKVVKLVVEDSIEDQIVQLQHKKLAMTEAALNKDPDAALGKLTVEDLGFLFKM